MTEASAGGTPLPPELAERMARRRAAMAEAGQAPPTAAPPAPAHVPPTAASTPRTPTRSTRQPAGKGSRLAMAGGAIGLGFGLVGAMAAAASADAGTPAAVVQRVVVPQAPIAAPPTQVIVMLPSNAETPITTIEVPAIAGGVALPELPAAPAPAVMASAPVAESHGS